LGTGVYDFDNDGLLDILIFHGGLIHLIPEEHTLFRGVGNGSSRMFRAKQGLCLSERTTARALVCRLHERRQGGRVRREPGRKGNSAA